MADIVSLALANARRFTEIEHAYVSTVEALAGALEAVDEYTSNHARALAEMALAVGRRMELSEPVLKRLENAGFLLRTRRQSDEREVESSRPDLVRAPADRVNTRTTRRGDRQRGAADLEFLLDVRRGGVRADLEPDGRFETAPTLSEELAVRRDAKVSDPMNRGPKTHPRPSRR